MKAHGQNPERDQASGIPVEELHREWGSSGACHQQLPGREASPVLGLWGLI